MSNEIETLRRWISESDHIVFFGGAGVSTESGIPDFRSVDGLYNQKYKFPPEQIISHSFFQDNPEEFFRFYRDKLIFPAAKPNRAHRRLAELEAAGKLSVILTQNIDGLHQDAGSQKVIELHGSTRRCYCASCYKKYDPIVVNECSGVPYCTCGGIIRPDVVLYEEGLSQQDLVDAAAYIRQADLLIVGGTSLAVYPAAGLINYYSGHRLVLINLSATPRDSDADLVLRERIGDVFAQV